MARRRATMFESRERAYAVCRARGDSRSAARVATLAGMADTEAEMANTVECETTAERPLTLHLDGTYAQLNALTGRTRDGCRANT